MRKLMTVLRWPLRPHRAGRSAPGMAGLPVASGNMPVVSRAELTRLVAQARQLPPRERQAFGAMLQQQLMTALGDQVAVA